MQLYLYADHESLELLASARPKALLIGSDFGNGNFGDVLQHLGSASLIREQTGFAIVSLCVLDAISRHADAAALRRSYGVDAVAFVTEMPIDAGVATGLGLRPVEILSNLSYVQLYGGGFLNELWGEFVLGIAEQFLARLPGVPYAISGQQIAPAFLPRVLTHVEKFTPQLVGVRDQASLDLATTGGMRADFSFDDAVEPLLDLGRRLELRVGDGAFIHLNSSDYTGNDEALVEMAAHLQLVATHVGNEGRPVLFQAFQDAREVVVDSIETVKRLDAGFPFADVETVLLVTSILEARAEGVPPRPLTGRFGYASSYHVTLWLQLHGIPCWLRGSNPYYMQKRAALGIEGRFEDFLDRMRCHDHAGNLQARSLWLDRLRQVMDSAKPAVNRIEWELPGDGVPLRQFNFKGEPRFERQVREAWRAYADGQHEIERLSSVIEDTDARLAIAEATIVANGSAADVLNARFGEHESERAVLLSRIEATAEERGELKLRLHDLENRANELGQLLADRQQRVVVQDGLLEEARASLHLCSEQLVAAENDLRHHRDEYAQAHVELQEAQTHVLELSGRLQACNEQLTVVGNDARRYREECSQTHAHLQEALAREHDQMQQLRAYNEQLTSAGADVRHFREQYEQVHLSLQEAAAHEREMAGRLQACNEQLTAVGHDARYFHMEYQRAHANLQSVSERERELAARMQEILRSRTWRWMRPFRVGGRYLRTGRFDPAGKVGLFDALRAIGRRLPISQSLRTSLGEMLVRFRRH